MAGIQPLTLIAQYDDLMRCHSTLAAGIEAGTFSTLFIFTDTVRLSSYINSFCYYFGDGAQSDH